MLIVVLQAGLPTSFWLSGFFNHHSFIAAIKQNFARANNCSIDEVRRGVKAFVKCNSGGFWVFGAGCWSRGIPSSLLQIFAKIYHTFTHRYICSHHHICTNQCICTYLDICILLNICKHPLIHWDIQVGQGEVAVHGLSLEGAQWDEVYSSTLLSWLLLLPNNAYGCRWRGSLLRAARDSSMSPPSYSFRLLSSK